MKKIYNQPIISQEKVMETMRICLSSTKQQTAPGPQLAPPMKFV